MGNKRGHKGGRRQFTNPQALERQKEKEEKEREWRRKRGEIVDSDEEDEESDEENSEEEDESSGEENSSSEEEEDAKEGEDDDKKKQPTVEVCNPNRLPQKQVNKRNLNSLVKEENKVELSRREREEIMKQTARANYNKLHAQGKTEEARADLARLAIIRQKREEAAKKRDADQKAANALEKAGSSKSKK